MDWEKIIAKQLFWNLYPEYIKNIYHSTIRQPNLKMGNIFV